MKSIRFPFWKLFWVVFTLYAAMIGLSVVFASIAPVDEAGMQLNKMLTWKYFIYQCFTFIFILFYYYYTLNIFYRYIVEKKETVEYLKTIVVILTVLIAYYLVSYHFVNPEKYMKTSLPLGILIFSYSITTVFYIGFSLLVAYLVYLRDERKQRKILEEQKMQLEIEKSQANFNFLKAQINPHFLHNTLNFLYAKSLPYSQELSEGILTLSDIMRYALSEGNAKDGKAPLADEIEHVRNVIKINQLRFSNNLKVNFEVNGVVNGAMIIPFVLITLVENAFKHGDLKTAEHPIDIRIDIEGKKLYFYCMNKKKTGPKELSTGIGLDNIKKRLDLAYGKDYNFKVKDDSEFYITELTINSL